MTELPMWVIYERPTDRPDVTYLARRFLCKPGAVGPTDATMGADSLEPLQRWLSEHGFVRVDRSPGDDPVIVEVWL